MNWNADCFNYHGRWQDTPDGKKAHWLKPYFEFCFKGTSFKIICDDVKKLVVYIDGVYCASNSEGTVAEFNVDDGEHLIRAISTSAGNPLIFKGVETEGKLSRAKSRDRYILFLGDSLTEANASHAFVIPKTIDCDYTVLAKGGMALRDKKGYYPLPEDRTEREGLEVAFFHYQAPAELGKRDEYSFENERQPESIVLNIGTNDALNAESEKQDFINHYVAFVKKLREIYPEAKIYAALPKADHESGWRLKIIEAAALETEKQVNNVQYVCSREWDVEISSDKVHLTDNGYAQYADCLMSVMGLK